MVFSLDCRLLDGQGNEPAHSPHLPRSSPEIEATSMPNGTCAVASGQSLGQRLKSVSEILILPLRRGLASGNKYASAGKHPTLMGAREAENLDGRTSHATGAFIRLDHLTHNMR